MSTSRWIIDKIEEGSAAVECDGRLHQVPLALLPAGAKEGDILEVRIDRDATEKARRRSEAQAARQAGPRNDPGGNIVL